MLRLSEISEKERSSREATEESLLGMLKEMVTRVKGEISAERKERETTEENMFKLIEETCAKLNHATQF